MAFIIASSKKPYRVYKINFHTMRIGCYKNETYIHLSQHLLSRHSCRWRHLVFIGLFLSLAACTQNNEISSQGIELTNNKVSITLSDEVQKALDSGVNLSFVAATAKQNKLLFIGWAKPHKQQVFKIHRHALSNHYLVHHSNQSVPRSFSSLRMSLEHVTQLSDAFFRQITEQASITGFEPKFRVYLDKYMLPTPMRINAFWSSDWDLDSGWQE